MMSPDTTAKTLSRRDISLYAISAILLVDQIALSAAVGQSALFWWLVVILLFLLPNTLVTAELGTRYPEQGGIYAWVKRAFGPRWGARITWLYWINIALWMPAIFLMFAGVFAALFWPGMTLWQQVLMGVVLCWLTALINSLPLGVSKWIPNLGTPLKFLVILVLGAAILLFFWVPGEPLDGSFLMQVGLGVGLTLVIGEVLVYRGERGVRAAALS